MGQARKTSIVSTVHRLAWSMVVVAAALLSGPAWSEPGVDEVRFDTLTGKTDSLSAYRGQVVVLNLWAVWCSPCIMEIPHLVRFQEDLEKVDATVIGLALDSGSAEAILGFWTNRLEIDPVYPLWKGSIEQATEHFDATTFPYTLVIDREGRIRERLLGMQTREDLAGAVEPYL